jgi:hypothetical protein
MDLFGPGNIGYGLMLTASGFAGVTGPTLIAYIPQTTGEPTRDLHLIAGVMLLGAVLPFMVQPLKGQTETVIRAPQPQYTPGRKR